MTSPFERPNHKATFQTSLAPQRDGNYHLFLPQWSSHHHGGHIGKVWRKSFVGIGRDKNAPFCLIDSFLPIVAKSLVRGAPATLTAKPAQGHPATL